MLNLTAFFVDERTIALFVLIGLDVLSGIVAAVRTHTFAWRRVGDWLLNDAQYVLGYLIWYAFTQTAIGGALGGVALDDILSTAGWSTAVAALVASIGNNLREAQAGTARPAGDPASRRV